MTRAEKGDLVMDYMFKIGADCDEILDAVCDLNIETSLKLIQENPKITLEELLSRIDRTDEE